MTVHLRKLCVGVDHVDQLAAWQTRRLAATGGKPGTLYHQTRNHPRRRDEILQGGSLYWIIRGVCGCASGSSVSRMRPCRWVSRTCAVDRPAA